MEEGKTGAKAGKWGKLALLSISEELRGAGVSKVGGRQAEARPWRALEVLLKGLHFILRVWVGEI